MWKKLFSFEQWLERTVIYQALHGGLVMLIPILLTGAFSLALQNIPIPGYFNLIRTFSGGLIYSFLNVIYSASFQLLSVYATVFIGLSYGREKSANRKSHFGNIAASLVVFFIMSGCGTKEFSFDAFGPKGMFIAIVSAMGGSALYWRLKNKLKGKGIRYSDGIDAEFNAVISIMGPLIVTTGIFALFDAAMCGFFQVNCIYDLFIREVNALFSLPMTENVRGFIYLITSSFLWFFGIHGSDCLEGVAEQYLIPADAANIAAAATGTNPEHILTKGFIDVFVLMGGCGTAVCLLAALLLCSRRRSNRLISKLAILPMIFNINEVMIFGLPVILNPIMFLPFLIVPIVSFIIAYFAMYLGWVPLVHVDVGWTTPILLGGYVATGSLAGTILQLVNFFVGTAIYIPFVKLLDRRLEFSAQDGYHRLVEYFQKCENEGEEVTLCALEGNMGVVAKALAGDIVDAIRYGDYEMYYQPQYRYDGTCIGVESLFRWKHPTLGMMYPPLAVKLAGESSRLLDLDCAVLDRVVSDTDKIHQKFGEDIKISVNVTGYSFMHPDYTKHICETYDCEMLDKMHLCLELTEQIAVHFDRITDKRFQALKKRGISFAIDDFSMGQTSIDYLKGDIFTLIKLDGSLTKGICSNGNCYEIISSLAQLASSLKIDVLAEYVETEEQKEMLHRAGCNLYQGYLYSPAVSLKDE